MRFRQWMLKECAERVEFRDLMMVFCRENILFWINAFVWSFDPRPSGKRGTTTPFITFACQDEVVLELVRAIKPPESDDFDELAARDVLIEKSRDMGATWVCLLVILWFVLFDPDQMDFFVMSYKKELVDGDAKSLFGKLDFCLQHLPSWMVPEYERTSMRLASRRNGSTVQGESTTGRAGVSGRFAGMFMDEFPKVDKGDDKEIWKNTGDCTDCRIINGTPAGVGNMYYELTNKEKYPEIKRVTMHWSKHARKARGLYVWPLGSPKPTILDKTYTFPKDYQFISFHNPGKVRSPWYDAQCRRRGWNKQDIAANLDIDYKSSQTGFFDYDEIQRLLIYTKDPEERGAIGEKTGQYSREDGGKLKLWFKVDASRRPPRGRYGIGCDIAAGTAGQYATPSCVSVVNLDTGEKVAEYANPGIRPDRFARFVRDLAKWFYDAIVIWEATGAVGGTFRKTMIDDLGYFNVYMRRSSEDSLSSGFTDKPGWSASREKQSELLDEYRAAITTGEFLNRSKEALLECLEFIYDSDGNVVHTVQLRKDDPSGAKANHGDQVIADALAYILVRDDGAVERKMDASEEKPSLDLVLNPPVGSMAWRDMLAKELEEEESETW